MTSGEKKTAMEQAKPKHYRDLLVWQKGMTLAVVDGVIAATALHHDLTIVTRNVKDFAGLGVTVFNPWEAS